MKTLFILLIAVAYFGNVESINCVYAINGKIIDGNHTCKPGDNLCTSVTLYSNNSGYEFLSKRQGCGSYMTWEKDNHVKDSCTNVGNFNIVGPFNGSVNCCDTDLCNGDAPKPAYNSATKNYSFIGCYIFIVSVSFFRA
uniref:UPAR/Ly6 domain-containing protein n=1 Tax=Panagrolaimus davidi TaxID=227884 RepID=A0A914QBD0_9BILA